MTQPLDGPVGPERIAELLRVRRDTVDRWRKRNVGFPDPSWPIAQTGRPLWTWRAVKKWAEATGRLQTEAKGPTRLTEWTDEELVEQCALSGHRGRSGAPVGGGDVMTDTTRWGRLPHDDYYSDDTWEHILVGHDCGGSPGGPEEYPTFAGFDPESVEEVVLWHTRSTEGFGSHEAAGLWRLSDGRWAVFSAWTDTTGWGCQDDARVTFHATEADAIRFGLTDEHREWFGIVLD